VLLIVRDDSHRDLRFGDHSWPTGHLWDQPKRRNASFDRHPGLLQVANAADFDSLFSTSMHAMTADAGAQSLPSDEKDRRSASCRRGRLLIEDEGNNLERSLMPRATASQSATADPGACI
jgi:hypothetical protein